MNREFSQASEEAIRMIVAHETALKACILLITRNSHLAQETYSDVMLAILQDWDKYDPSRPFEAWACGVARCVARANCRKEAHRRCISDAAMDDVVQEVADQEESVIALRRSALPGCMERLPFIHRQLIKLRYFEDQSYGQISAVVGRTVATLYVLSNRVHKTLRACIESRISEQ